MPDSIDQLDVLNTYREAEVRGTELLQRLLRDNDDPKMTGYFTWQLADEARHIELLTGLISELGGTPPVIRKMALPARCNRNSSNATLEILAYLHATEARLQQRYLEHIRRRHPDPRIVSILRTLASDEEWHLAGVEAFLLKQEKKFGWTRVAATLDHYWNLARRM